MKRWDLRKSRRARRLGAPCVPAHHGQEVPLRAAGGQEGEHLRFSPSCQSTPFPSGRAARAKVSPALPLQPGLSDKVSKISATPEGAGAHGAPDGTRSERRLRANSGHKPNVVSTPAFRGERKRKLPRRYRKSNFPQNVEKFVCGRGHP